MIRYDLVTRDSSYGHPARAGDLGLPRIDDRYLDCSVYLYPSIGEAERGEGIGGSGFLVAAPVAGVGTYTVCITNRHVVEKGCTVARLNSIDGGARAVDFNEQNWLFADDGLDLAVAPIPAREMQARYAQVPADVFLTRERLAEFDIGPGDDTFLVGRFIGRDGGQTNIPTVRFGNISQMPSGTLDEYGRTQESYLVESRSIGGYSGSPVFVYIPPLAPRPNKASLDSRYFGPFLLGVDWCHFFQKEMVLDGKGREWGSGNHVAVNSGFMGVIPAWHLLALIGNQKFRDLVEHQPLVAVHSFGNRPIR